MAENVAGRLDVQSNSGKSTITLDGNARDPFGAAGAAAGEIMVKRETGEPSIRMNAGNATLYIGGNGRHGDLLVFKANSNHEDFGAASVRIDGQRGDITLQNADCAEYFRIAQGSTPLPGDVVVIERDTYVRTSTVPYDRLVAGVVSGAGRFRPGLLLGNEPGMVNACPVALFGRVYCNVTTEAGEIEVGDLLTTSSLTGHAMKVTDNTRAFGTVLGKALQGLREGTGAIPILLALQ